MTELMYNGFEELNENELYEVDGGIGFIAACIFVGKCAAIAAGTGFVAGCVYGLVFD